MKRVGIYPGSFDPVHKGHVAFATHALEQCGLDTVVFLPERQPRGKPGVAPLVQRTRQLEVALGTTKKLQMFHPSSSPFNVKQTLPELQKYFSDAQLTLLVGSDVARTLAHWQELDKLLAVMEIAIGIRDNETSQQLEDHLKTIEELVSFSVKYHIVHTPYAHMSSTLLKVR